MDHEHNKLVRWHKPGLAWVAFRRNARAHFDTSGGVRKRGSYIFIDKSNCFMHLEGHSHYFIIFHSLFGVRTLSGIVLDPAFHEHALRR